MGWHPLDPAELEARTEVHARVSEIEDLPHDVQVTASILMLNCRYRAVLDILHVHFKIPADWSQ